MKKYIVLVPALIMAGFLACQSGNMEPRDLQGKKALLKEKKERLALLKEEIKDLEDEILILDPPKEKAPTLVNVHEVKSEIFQRFVDLQGVVTTDDLVMASSETGGRIIKTYVKEGSRVKKGQLIAKIDMETLKKQMSELETSLSLATTVYERQKRLWEQEIGSEIQYLQTKTSKESLEKNLETLNSQLSKQNVYAPISGIIDKEFLKGGEMAAPGTPIVQILDTRKIKIEADVPESYIGKLNKGDKVAVYFPALGDTLFQKITSLGRTIDPSNRTFEIEIEMNNIDGRLKPNLLAEITFIDLEIKDAIILPVDFVLEEVTGKKFVFLAVNKEGKIRSEKREINLGESYSGNVVVKKGINIGDQVILEGARNISPNDPLIIANQKQESTNE